MSAAEPMPGIPPEVACPHCGGYVRGHQWIGQPNCSVNAVFTEPITHETIIDVQAIIDSSAQRWQGSIFTERPRA